jgi:hypothetical protein
MPPPKILKEVQPGDFVGGYVAPIVGEDSRVPVLEVFKGEIPDPAQAALIGSGVRIYEFMPVDGNELDTTSDPFAVAAVEGAKDEGNGHIGVELTFVVGGEASSSHTDSPNPVLEGGESFRGLFRALTADEGVDRLHIRRENTDLTGAELSMLGFSATGTNPDMLTLDLGSRS